MTIQHLIIQEDLEHHRISELLEEKRFKEANDIFCIPFNGRAKDYFLLFLNSSSIHGLNHLTKGQRHLSEISLWLLVVMLSVTGTFYLSRSTWDRYQESPTVISMDRDMFAWNTTFPGVTVCPHKKLDEEKLSHFIRKSNAPDKTALEVFIRELAKANYTSFKNVPEYSDISSDQYMDLLVNLSTNFAPTLTIGSTGVFLQLEETITEMGLCYTVNSYASFYNSPKYRASNRWDIVPDKDKSTFYVHPLDGEVFAQLINMSTGYDVYLHGPAEAPDISMRHQSSDDGYYMQLHVTALTIYTSPVAAELTVAQRKCRFPQENILKHNSVYSYTLCRMECRIRLALEHCGCIPHFYRRLAKEKVCDVKGLHCLAGKDEMFFGLHDEDTGENKCECLPICDDVNYTVQSLVLQEWFLGTNLQWGMVTYPRLRYRRDIIFGFTDVLVSVGSMAGLFLGCSVLSFTEIIYFLTLRLFWYIAEVHKKITIKQ